MPVGRRERRPALIVVAISAAVFLALQPFAKVPLAPIWAFIPVYETLVVINDLITAVLLLGQFAIVRSRAVLVLAGGYLFTASAATLHALTFPGLFSPEGLFGAGPQTTAWLFMAWHGGFPAFVAGYALLKGRGGEVAPGTARRAVASCAIAALALALGFGALATAGHDLLPVNLDGNRVLPEGFAVTSAVWGVNLAALVILCVRRPVSVIDLWLMVVMCVWLFDLALSTVLNGQRFDVGFYAGRIYGLLGVSFVLLVLLLENGQLYANLVKAHRELRRLATADPLTGIANRRAFELAIDREWRRAARSDMPLSLLMIDVDFFKRFNDSQGHVAGDECLRRVAGALAGSLKRAGDLAARYGGEEFAVILPNTSAEEARSVGEALCRAVDDLRISHDASLVASHVTISIGVASLMVRSEPKGQPSALIEAADRALYGAKHAGRHRVWDAGAMADARTAALP
ncbi:MAG: GGDEF domain-containing protein [Alphaproteobacteria bacterium]|nr:GGDEF domain-containing protein [Alphaproteobacteria bacterium]